MHARMYLTCLAVCHFGFFGFWIKCFGCDLHQWPVIVIVTTCGRALQWSLEMPWSRTFIRYSDATVTLYAKLRPPVNITVTVTCVLLFGATSEVRWHILVAAWLLQQVWRQARVRAKTALWSSKPSSTALCCAETAGGAERPAALGLAYSALIIRILQKLWTDWIAHNKHEPLRPQATPRWRGGGCEWRATRCAERCVPY